MQLKVREVIDADAALKVLVASKKVVGDLYFKLATFRRKSLSGVVQDYEDKRQTLLAEYSDPLKDEKGVATGRTAVIDANKHKTYSTTVTGLLNAPTEIKDEYIPVIPRKLIMDALADNLEAASFLEWMIGGPETDVQKEEKLIKKAEPAEKTE